MRISVIGTGHLGTIHSRLWAQHSTAKLSGIYDVDSTRATAIAAEYSTTAHSSIQDAIENCDAVTIAVPTSEHFRVAMECIEAGKHCLIEKPITHTYDEAQELIRAAAEKNVILQVGHVERFNPAFVAAQSYSLSPLFIEAHRLSQFRPRATDVSVIHDLMIHDIDIVLWLVKSPAVSISANGVAVLTDTPDIANARVEFANGAVANFTASRLSANAMRKMRIFQRDAYLSLDFSKPSVEVYRIADDDMPSSGIPAMMLGQIDAGTHKKSIMFEQPTVPQLNAIAEEQNSFVESVVNGAPISVSAADAAEALRIASEIATIVESRKEL
ncbi:MAG: Gfo/Idh/MocA family oxidoreductase [Candidatus Kapabacteria bacterium]|nr:Gfo/Idh/MocA family oxidoreductase [Candidatus Kapabacteria bacterium]